MMNRVVDVTGVVATNDEKMAKHNLFETARCFADVYVLAPGQAQSIHRHEGEDKFYYVLSGRGTVISGTSSYDVSPGSIVFCPAGDDHGVENAVDAEQNLRLLVFMAPHPRASQSSH